jgi:hypothetical protein
VLGSPKYSFQNTKRENPRKVLLNILFKIQKERTAQASPKYSIFSFNESILCNSSITEYGRPAASGANGRWGAFGPGAAEGGPSRNE